MTDQLQLCPPERALHLLDLDELLGARPTEATLRHTIDAYLDAAEWSPDDHVVVRTSWGPAERAAIDLDCGWRAQRQPIAAPHPRLVAGRHDRLVIGSGDAAYAELAGEVARLGGTVWVVARGRRLSPELAGHADHVVTLPDGRRPARPRRTA
jgi:hypothetical protein